MKHTAKVFVSLLAVSVLAGCSDASAKLNDSSTVLFSVGNKTVTKGDAYTQLKSLEGATTVINNANKIIADAEIEITDEMKEEGQETLDSYKSYYGDTFTTYLDQQGMTEEEYMNEYLIPSLQAEKLPQKYVEENFDAIVKTYSPVKATLLNFSSQDDANNALAELKDGKEAAEAASDNNSDSSGKSTIYTIESTSVDSMVRTVLNSGSPDDGWTLVPSSDGSTYVLVHIDENDASKFKDEAAETLASISQVRSDSTTYWFKKYGFHVYDKTIYDAIASDYPDNLVQNIADTAE